MSFTQTIAPARHVEIDGDAHTLTASDSVAGVLPRFSELGIGALALPGGPGRLARTYALTAEEVVAESNGRVAYSAVPVGRIVVAVGLAYALEHASAACRRARAFAASAPDGVTVKTFLQTLPAIEEIPEELHGRRVLAVAATYDGPAEEGETILAPLHAYGEPLVAFFAPVPSEVVAGLRRLETAILG
jgi:hypothetical protein